MIKDYIGADRKYRLRPWVRCVAGALAAVMTACAIGVIPKTPQEVGATEEVAQVKNVNLGAGGIGAPSIADDKDDYWAGSYVYFGEYNNEPIKFRVLSPNTQDYNKAGDTTTRTMLLECADILYTSTYDNVRTFDWETCVLRRSLNSMKDGNNYDYSVTGLLTTAFSGVEQKAIVESTRLTEPEYEWGSVHKGYTSLTGDKIFLLTSYEYGIAEYGFYERSYSNTRVKKYNGQVYDYWERATGDSHNHVGTDGNHLSYSSSANSQYFVYGVSPSLNINLESILYTSKSNSEKSAMFGVTTDASDNEEWNITLKDSIGFDAKRKDGLTTSVKPGDSVTVTVNSVPKMSTGEEYSKLYAMLVDAAGTVHAYGKIADSAVTGDVDVTIPESVAEGNYELKVWAETTKSSATSNTTDYATNMATIPLGLQGAIDSVDVTGVEVPKANVELDNSAVCADDNIVSTTLSWKLGDEEATGVAGYDKVYTAYITLTATEGIDFADNVTATVNGNPAMSVELNADGTLTVGYTFEATEKKGAVLEVVAPVFEEVCLNYAQQPTKPMIITNVGDEIAQINGYELSGEVAFKVVGSILGIEPGASADTWCLEPLGNLAVGEYTTTVTITYNGDKKVSFDVRFVVKSNSIDAIDVTDIMPPKAGSLLDMEAVCNTEGIVTNAGWIYWNNLTSGESIDDENVSAQYNTQYEVKGTMYIHADYVVASDVKITVNGNAVTSFEIDEYGAVTFTYIFEPTEKEKMEKPNVTINYMEETLEGFVTDGSYTINGVPVTVTDGKVAIKESWFGTTVSIVRKGDDTYDDSEPQSLYIPERPAAPDVTEADETVYGNNDGKIQGTTVDMEYRRVIPVEWTGCTDTEVDNLSPGYYEVRLKATDTSFAGKSAQVEIKTGVHVCDVSVVDGTGDGTYPVGEVITVVADAAPQGKQFKCWSVVYGLAVLGDSRDATTTLVVPQGAVEIKAEYEDIPVVEPPTEAPTEEPTEEPTEAPTEAPTEEPTEEPTEVSTETLTEASTEESTEAETETSTEASTEEPTEEYVESETESGESPSTGDNNNITWIIIAMMLSMGAMLATFYNKAKKFDQ